jgi:hypothetical protein
MAASRGRPGAMAPLQFVNLPLAPRWMSHLHPGDQPAPAAGTEEDWRSSIALPRTRSAPFRRSNATDCGSRQRWRQGSAPAHARSCRPLRCVRDTHDARCTTTGAPSRRNNRGGLRCPQATPFWPEPRWRRGTASLRASGIYLTRTLSRLLVAAQITRIPARTPRMASFARDHRAASMGPASS